MHKIVFCAAVMAMLPTVSSAQTFESEKFNWSWQGQMDVGGLKISQSGNVCVSKDMAKEHLTEAFRTYDEGCEVLGWNPQGETTYFALACRGEQSTDLAGELTVVKDVAELKLIGNVHLANNNELPTSGTLKGNWTGDCMVEDAAEATQIAHADGAVEAPEAVEVAQAEAPVIAPELAVMSEEGESLEVTEVASEEAATEDETLTPLAAPSEIQEAPIVEAMPVVEGVL